jgi:hypothetical protein
MSCLHEASVSCREIAVADIPTVAALLDVGFPSRGRAYWEDGLSRLAAYAPPDGFPKFGYLLVSGKTPVGVLLLIFSNNITAAGQIVRCNVSSWYVKPEFRIYASPFALRAIRSTHAETYINVSPAKHTLQTIEAQGFKEATVGYFAGIPVFGRRPHDLTIVSSSEKWKQSKLISPSQLQLLADHERFGCICLWCETATRGQAFIFRRRLTRGLPSALLIYSDSLNDVEEFAGSIGGFLFQRGLPIMIIGAEKPLKGIFGRYFPTKLQVYYKGTGRPRGSDLSYTDAAIFGL